MQIRVENAWLGYVSLVQETIGVDPSGKQSRTLDADDIGFSTWTGLQKHTLDFSEQRCWCEPATVSLWSTWNCGSKL